jgi:hypothetical protein
MSSAPVVPTPWEPLEDTGSGSGSVGPGLGPQPGQPGVSTGGGISSAASPQPSKPGGSPGVGFGPGATSPGLGPQPGQPGGSPGPSSGPGAAAGPAPHGPTGTPDPKGGTVLQPKPPPGQPVAAESPLVQEFIKLHAMEEGSLPNSYTLERAQRTLGTLTDQELESLGIPKGDRANLASILGKLSKFYDRGAPSPAIAGGLTAAYGIPAKDTIGPASKDFRPITEADARWDKHVEEALSGGADNWARLEVAVALTLGSRDASGRMDPAELSNIADSVGGVVGFAAALGSTVRSNTSVDETGGELGVEKFSQSIKAGADRATELQKASISESVRYLNDRLNTRLPPPEFRRR